METKGNQTPPNLSKPIPIHQTQPKLYQPNQMKTIHTKWNETKPNLTKVIQINPNQTKPE